MTNGNYALTNSKNLLCDAVRELLSAQKSWHALYNEKCEGNGNAAFPFEKNVMHFYSMSSELQSYSKLTSPCCCDNASIAPTLLMQKLKHRQDIIFLKSPWKSQAAR